MKNQAKNLIVQAITIMLDADDLMGTAQSKAVKLSTYAPGTMVAAGTAAILHVTKMSDGEKKERAKLHHTNVIKALNVLLHEKGQHLNAALNKEKAVFNKEYTAPKSASSKNGKPARSEKAQLKTARAAVTNAVNGQKIAAKSEKAAQSKLDKAQVTGQKLVIQIEKLTEENRKLKAVIAQINKTASGKKSVTAARAVVTKKMAS